MQIADKYAPQEIEQKWYDYWERHGLFHSEPDAREPYTIVIPPPNVTGMLHMGHMLNNTLQDVLIRRARMHSAALYPIFFCRWLTAADSTITARLRPGLIGREWQTILFPRYSVYSS